MSHDDLVCFGPNYHPEKAPSHDEVRKAVDTLKAHLNAEWISEGCKTDHAFGCTSCQAAMLERELDGLIGWLDDADERDQSDHSGITDDIPA